MASNTIFPKGEKEFNKWLVREYFKYGTVEEVFRVHRYSLPLSVATYHRVLDRWGVVKTVGPNDKLTEALDFLNHLTQDSISLEDLYKKIPLRFQTSISTLYRIVGYMKEGVTRRVGVGLVITPYNKPESMLIAHDISTPRLELGKFFNSISIPMGYARKRDSRKINVKRILQQEVFTEKVIDNTFPDGLINNELEPFMYLDIADVRVAIYKIQLTKELSKKAEFSSYKLSKFSIISIDEALSLGKNARVGVKEAVLGYQKYLRLLGKNLSANPIQVSSWINQKLLTVTVDLEE